MASQNRLAFEVSAFAAGITYMLGCLAKLVKSITTLAILHPAGLLCQESLILLETLPFVYRIEISETSVASGKQTSILIAK
jgi:hypothetical protein